MATILFTAAAVAFLLGLFQIYLDFFDHASGEDKFYYFLVAAVCFGFGAVVKGRG